MTGKRGQEKGNNFKGFVPGKVEDCGTVKGRKFVRQPNGIPVCRCVGSKDCHICKVGAVSFEKWQVAQETVN